MMALTDRNRKRFTLVEVLVLGIVGFLLLAAVLRIFTSGVKSSSHGVEKLKSIQSLALFLEYFQKDIANTTEFSTNSPDRLVLKTSTYEVGSGARIEYDLVLSVTEQAGKVAYLAYEPEGAGLPEELMAKRFFKNQLEKLEFRKVETNVNVGSKVIKKSGFAVSMVFHDRATGARLDFDRIFWPSRCGENRVSDGFHASGNP